MLDRTAQRLASAERMQQPATLCVLIRGCNDLTTRCSNYICSVERGFYRRIYTSIRRFREMDPLSVTASVFAILQLTGAVIAYLNDVKDAPKECQQCTIEASNLQNLLINLRYCLERGQASDPWFAIIQTLNVENGPFDQYRQALEQLQSKIDVGTGATKVKRQLAWKFNKAEVAGILARMERLKTLISIALEMDHL